MANVRFAPLEIRPDSLADMVYEAIRQSIMDKSLAPGSRVSENGFAQQLGVSKTPVREALLKLRRIGVIESDGLRGVKVVRPSRTKIRQAYEIREALEVFAVRTVAARLSGADLERISDAAARSLGCARSGDQDGFREQDRVFHRVIAEAAANPRLTEMIEEVFTLIVTLRQRDYPNVAASLKCATAHMRIADAITRHDVEGAEAAAREHIRQVERYVLAGSAVVQAR
jgi:GntR family transcriptional regulator, rspAB operon transcriptional repressor